MTTRAVYTSASSGPVTGPAYMDQIAGHIKKLYDAAAFPLTAVGGTANAVTATLDPVLDGSGLVAGMRFGITWGSTNTGGVTLALNGGSAVSVLDAAGSALVAGALVAGTRSLLEYVGAAFRVINSASSTSLGGTHYYQAFTASGTWTKPAGLDPNTMVTIEAWGGGGGGGTNSGGAGGGGGGYQRGIFRLGDLPSSVAVSIGAGGAGGSGTAGSTGGNTTFGALLTAWGGGGGQRGSMTTGGGGGGALSAGAVGGMPGMGGGAGTSAASGANATYPEGGGGGGGGDLSGGPYAGGSSVWGGGGGGGRSGSYGSGGQSLFGGAGGAAANTAGIAGSAPGGGGGGGNSTGGAGARGECRIWL